MLCFSLSLKIPIHTSTIWMESILKELKIEVKRSIKLQIDKKSDINLENNPILHGMSKHIETKFHFLREQVNQEKLEVAHCLTSAQVVDVLTK